jgi:hypothetical protein
LIGSSDQLGNEVGSRTQCSVSLLSRLIVSIEQTSATRWLEEAFIKLSWTTTCS